MPRFSVTNKTVALILIRMKTAFVILFLSGTDRLRIVAVAHVKRQPNYRSERLKSNELE